MCTVYVSYVVTVCDSMLLHVLVGGSVVSLICFVVNIASWEKTLQV